MATSSSSKHIPLVSNFSGFFAKFSAKVSIFLSILRVKKSVNAEASSKYVASQWSRVMMEEVREARRLGKTFKFSQSHDERLDKLLKETPLGLCRDEDWEKMRDVGAEIVD